MIVCFGSLNADLIFRLPVIPRSGQTLLADDLAVQAGGKGANQAAAAARDGAEVAMVGAVGGDALAAVALAGLREAGADLARVRGGDGGRRLARPGQGDRPGRHHGGRGSLRRGPGRGPRPRRALAPRDGAGKRRPLACGRRGSQASLPRRAETDRALRLI